MIVLDTHIWIWWVHDAPELPQAYRMLIEQHEALGLGVSAISCWGVAKLVERGHLRYHAAPPLERLLIEQIVICWLQLAQTQSSYTKMMIDATPAERGMYWERRLTQVQNRYVRATEALARVRRLSRGIPLQINMGATGQHC